MISEKLAKHIDEIISKIVEETSVTGGEAHNSKNAFLTPANYLVKKFKYKKANKPKNLKTFDTVKFTKEEITNIVKEELLNEISYRRFSESVSKVSSERKITRALNEVRKRIREIEQVIEYSQRLKTENTIKSNNFWSNKTEQLSALSERLNDLSNKIRTLSQ
jgi:hypothetical protein